MTFTYAGWKPEEQLFEEAGVMYSRDQVEGFTAYHYTLIHINTNTQIPRTVYILGSDIDTLLAHWNRGADWKVERRV